MLGTMGDNTDVAKSSEKEININPHASASPIMDNSSNGDPLHAEPFVEHTLPFKVPGSAHNLNYQKHLEQIQKNSNSK